MTRSTSPSLVLVVATIGVLSVPSSSHAQATDCMDPQAPLAGTAERTTFESRGREIQGLLYRPTRPNGAGVVVLHDREGIREDLARYEAQLGRLTSCGYTVLVPSYYDAAGPRSRNDPLLGEKWDQAIDQAIVRVSTAPGVDANRIGIWGHGRGGGLALSNALDGTAAKAVVAVSAQARAANGRDAPPILLIAGDHDPEAPLHETENLGRELRQRGAADVRVEPVPATVREFEPATWDAVFQRTKSFFDAQLTPAN